MKKIHHFVQSEDGATAIEYALIAAGIAIVIIAAVNLLGDNLTGTFKEIACQLEGKTYDASNDGCVAKPAA